MAEQDPPVDTGAAYCPPEPGSVEEQVSRAGVWHLKKAEAWNALFPKGTPVTYTDDEGAEHATRTRSEAWSLPDGTAVVLLDGLRGARPLGRVQP